jgi:PAS domain S-box-containing protein
MPLAPAASQESSLSRTPHASRLAVATACAAIVLSAAILVISRNQPGLILLIAAIIVLGTLIGLHGRSLRISQKEFLRAKLSLRDRDFDLHSLLDSTFDAVLILDERLICRKANRAAGRLLGVSESQLVGRSLSQFVCDTTEVSGARNVLGEQPRRGRLELIRADGVRILADFSSAKGRFTGQQLLLLRDQTALVCAEEAKSRSLTAARSSMVEARILRQATLALSQAGPLNIVLDDLLDILHSAVQYESARILLFESPNRLFSAREKFREGGRQTEPTDMFDLNASPLLSKALEERRAILVADDEMARDRCRLPWQTTAGTWLCVPLFAGAEKLGFLSLTRSGDLSFTPADLRISTAIAVPTSLAVYSSRLYERADIFRSELVERLRGLRPD